MTRTRRWASAVALCLLCAGCDATLPEADSPAARLYAQRCKGCHQVFAPRSLTYAMWEYQVDRKRAEFARNGMAPLTENERSMILEYLKRHSQ